MKSNAKHPLASLRHVAALTLLSTAAPAAFADFSFTDAGPYDYNTTGNWSGGTINNTWSTALTANQSITFAADTTLSGQLTIGNTSLFSHTFTGSGGNRTLTLGGNISLGTSTTNANKVTLGSTTDGQKLDLNLGGASRTFGISTNRTLEVLNVLSGANSITKTGAGTLLLTNTANTYTGSTSIGSSGVIGGVLEVTKLSNGGVDSSIGKASNANTNLVFGGTGTGTLRYVGSGDSTDRRFLVGGIGAIFDASGTGALNWTNTAAPDVSPSSGTARTITFRGSNTDNNTMSASFLDSGAGKTSFLKDGTGTWVLAGNNINTGNITVTAGKLAIGASNRLGDTALLIMNGGTFSTEGFSETLGTLTLSAASTIDLGAGASALVFADSSGTTWTASIGLSFTNFTTGVDSIRIGTTSGGLTETQLAQITLNGFAASIDANGFLSISSIPEPSAYALLVGAGGLLLAASRRRRSA